MLFVIYYNVSRYAIKILEQIPSILNKQVSREYIDSFSNAEKALLYHIVFDVTKQKQVSLNETLEHFTSAGT